MKQASAACHFEQAAIWRDQLRAIERLEVNQKVYLTSRESFDVISLARRGAQSAANVFAVRNGEVKRRALAGFALERDDAVKLANDAIDSGKAEPRAFDTRRHVRFGKPVTLSLGKPDAVIDNFNARGVPVRRHPYLDAPVRRRAFFCDPRADRLAGVFQEI